MVFKKVEAWIDDNGILYKDLQTAEESYKKDRIMELIKQIFPIAESDGLAKDIAIYLPYSQYLLPKLRELIVKLEDEGLI